MYDKVYGRLLRCMSPFHHKVLRFNYDLPLEQLKEILKTIVEIIDQSYNLDIICKSQDRLEYDGRACKGYKELTLSELKTIFDNEQLLYNFGNEHAWMKVGLFSEKLDWYLRIFIEDEKNLSRLEPKIGNVEVYACDDVIAKIAKQLEDQTVGHMLIEGAKKYIEEIYI
ncbi:MAG: hypothetical protein JG777_3070 [Clostridia bacterium]|jgi:hypothetical protein|nr:hypothetical protein [Clostridia bacterium]